MSKYEYILPILSLLKCQNNALKINFFIGGNQSGRRESHNVLENISEVDSTTGSNISGGAIKAHETDAAVAAISSMFPTVDEAHIKDLLKK